jgi:hypothetical protein
VSGWRFEVIRFPSAAREVARLLAVDPPPECRIEHGRITVVFRRLSATRWPEAQQFEYAMGAVNVVRQVFSSDDRRQLRKAASRAMRVVFEDASVVGGCAVVARWECVVPASYHSL